MKLNFIKQFVIDYKERAGKLSELTWANVYHDSISDKPWLQAIGLNVGRWAGGYSFFYILNRILNDVKPTKVIEFGLGESSKFISTYIQNELRETKHIVIEHDNIWVENFNSRFILSQNSNIILKKLIKQNIKGFTVTTYDSFFNEVDNDIQLYIIDGPLGSDRYSRYDIIKLLEKRKNFDDFIIIFDDVDRRGEQDTVVDIYNFLDSNKVNFFTEVYKGEKWQRVIVSEKYKWLISL